MSKKLSLQMDISSPILKKYRGDDDDPHFVPNSPIIGRQTLSEEEEEELKQVCALVLAQVPHSDDMSDDPLKYIAAQILEGKKPQQVITKQEHRPDPAQHHETATGAAQTLFDRQGDSATPSDASHRNTYTTADYYTPLTSAGLTPGDSARRYSEAARKSLTGVKKPGSNLRNSSNAVTSSRITSTGVPSPEAQKYSAEADAIKKSLRLVTDGSSRPQSGSVKSMDQPRPIRFSVPDLNKRLPLPPSPPAETYALEEQKQPHISRLMKTIRKKKSTNLEGRSFSTSSTPPMPSPPAFELPKTPYPRSSTTQNTASEPPKKRFRIPLFHRRQRPADVLVA